MPGTSAQKFAITNGGVPSFGRYTLEDVFVNDGL